jgi:hypothetical protein
MPADYFWRVAFRALLALRAAGSVASGALDVQWSGVATSKGWQRPDLDSERIKPFVDVAEFFAGKCPH